MSSNGNFGEREKTGFLGYIEDTFEKWWEDAAGMREIWRQDEIDKLAASSSYGAKNKKNDPLDFKDIGSIRPKEDWKDNTNMAIKVKPKAQALKANLLNPLLSKNELPISLDRTPRSDVVEMLGGQLPEPMQKILNDNQQDRLERVEQYLKDILAESDFEAVIQSSIDIMVDKGSVAAESPIECYKKQRQYKLVTGVDPNTGSQIPQPISTPIVKDVLTLKTEVFEPYNLILDPQANANPQEGLGCFRVKWANEQELSRFMANDNYDREAILKVLDTDNEFATPEGSSFTSVSDLKTYKFFQTLHQNPTKSIELIDFYGCVTRKDLEEWGEEELLSELEQVYSEDMYISGTPYDTFEVHLVLANRQIILKTPNYSPDRSRPFSYSGLVHLTGTNYFFSIYSLARPLTRVMTRMMRRSIDNETLVGSFMVGYDPKLVDEKSLVFKPLGRIKVKPGASAVAEANGSRGISSMIHQFNFSSVSQRLMEMYMIFENLLDEISMVPRNLTGVGAPGAETATEVTENLSSAQVMQLMILKYYDKNFIVPIIERIYHYLQSSSEVSENVKGDAKIIARGATTFTIQAMNKRRITELLQVLPSLAQISPEQLSNIKFDEITSILLESIGFEREEILQDPEGVEKIKALQTQLEQISQAFEQAKQALEKSTKENEKLTKENTQINHDNYDLRHNTDIKGKNLKLDLENQALRHKLENKQQYINERMTMMDKRIKEVQNGQAKLQGGETNRLSRSPRGREDGEGYNK